MLLLRLFVLLTSEGAGLTLLVGFTSRLSGIPHCKSTPIIASFQLRFCVAFRVFWLKELWVLWTMCTGKTWRTHATLLLRSWDSRTYSIFFFFDKKNLLFWYYNNHSRYIVRVKIGCNAEDDTLIGAKIGSNIRPIAMATCVHFHMSSLQRVEYTGATRPKLSSLGEKVRV